MLANILEAIANFGANVSTLCLFGWIDEPEAPKSIIEK